MFKLIAYKLLGVFLLGLSDQLANLGIATYNYASEQRAPPNYAVEQTAPDDWLTGWMDESSSPLRNYKQFFGLSVRNQMALEEGRAAIERMDPANWVTRWAEIRYPLANKDQYLFSLDPLTIENAMKVAIKDSTIGHFVFNEQSRYASFYKGEPDYHNSNIQIYRKMQLAHTIQNGAPVWQARMFYDTSRSSSIYSEDSMTLQGAIERANQDSEIDYFAFYPGMGSENGMVLFFPEEIPKENPKYELFFKSGIILK